MHVHQPKRKNESLEISPEQAIYISAEHYIKSDSGPLRRHNRALCFGHDVSPGVLLPILKKASKEQAFDEPGSFVPVFNKPASICNSS